MELSLNQIQVMDSKKIFNFLLPTINEIYKLFEYSGIPIQSYYDLVLEEITNSKNTYTSNIPYSNLLKKKLKTILFEKVKNLLLDPETSFDIIDNYINQNFTKISGYKYSIKYLKKLDNFFEYYNFIPNPDLIIKLINENTTFRKIIELILNHYYLKIISEDLEKIFDNDLLVLIIEIYCMLNNIEIKEEPDNETYDYIGNGIIDNTKMYLNEIGQKPLLSIDEERELARKIAKGDTKAKKLFIESNLKLVVSIAKKYTGRGLDFLDLIQEGNLGLMKATDKYDVEKGYKFSTYATHWIRQSITRALADKSRIIRLPVHVYEKINKYIKAVNKLNSNLNRQPTIDEIANEMRLSISKVAELQKLQNDTISLNITLNTDNNDTELGDFIPSDEDTLEDIVVDGTLQHMVRKLFKECHLKEREIEILMCRNGFGNKKPMTLEELGNRYNVTRERIRQIEEKALAKIRGSRYAESLADYMDFPKESLKNAKEFNKKYYEKRSKSKKRKDKNMSKKVQTIYEYFNNYTREQVDKMLSKLTEEEREILTLRYGEDLDNPKKSEKWDDNSSYQYYGSVLPRMKRMLANPNYVPKPRKKKIVKEKIKEESMISTAIKKQKEDVKDSKEDKKKTSEFDKKMTTEKFAKLVTTDKKNITSPNNNIKKISEMSSNEIISETLTPMQEQDNIESKSTQKATELNVQEEKSNNITKDEYIRILELLKTPSFNQIMNVLTAKESIIISLKLGYVEGKYFSTKSIAQFLGIEEEEVRECTKKILLLYKDSINEFIDKAIEYTTDKQNLNTLRKDC